MSRPEPGRRSTPRRSLLKERNGLPDTTRVRSQDDPFGPPPTSPPSVEQPLPSQATAEDSSSIRTIGEHRFVVIWLGAFATISFSGLTGLLMESRWSYVTLGATFAALFVVVLAVSLPVAPMKRATGAELSP